MFLPLLWVLVTAPPSAVPPSPDVLVICPAELRSALAPWEAYRRSEGHVLRVVGAPAGTDGIKAAIGQAYREGRLKYVVVIGDVAADRAAASGGRPPIVPTEYAPARVNVRWGSQPTIATDTPYADVDGDGLPDVAVGRIPADSPAELAAFVRKVIRYERQGGAGPWQRQIDVVAGAGGFGPLADGLIEAAARCVFHETVPAGYNVRATLVGAGRDAALPAGGVRSLAREELSGGCLAWVYLGHGLPTELDHVPTPAARRGDSPGAGDEPILSVDDVARLRCGAASPLAVLVACYTGALDAQSDCLAERLAMAEHGPVAVIAATRVTMPYGNTVLGCELLRACFAAPDAVLGDIWRQTQRRTLADAGGDPLRMSLDALARGVSPPPVELAAERQEHVWMYQLLGDPLLRLRRPEALQLQPPGDVAAGQVLTVAGRSGVSGRCTVELMPTAAHTGNEIALATATEPIEAGPFRVTLAVPADASGRYTVRAFVISGEHAALGAASVTVQSAPERISRGGARPTVR